MFEVEKISGGYGGKTVISDISISIGSGEFAGIIGPNGCGKSTMLKLMTKVLMPAKGRISLEGQDISSIDLKQFCRRVSFVPQDTMINFSFTVEEIVLMGRIPHLGRMQVETKKDHEIAERAMRLTETLTLKDRLIDEISAGERQRVIVARALAQEPRMLLLDEPTSHLDIGHELQLMDLLARLNRKEGLTIIIVLHGLNLAAEFCGRLVLLCNGAIAAEGAPEDVLTYQNIEKVYQTTVVVKKNPISSKPYVIPIPENYRQ